MKKGYFLLVLFLAGCGQLPPYEQKVVEVCGRLESCFERFTQEGCNWSLTEFYILPEDCLDKAISVSGCEQLGDEVNSLPMCWPACGDEDSQVCEGDTIHVCKEGKYYRAKCSGVCEMLLGKKSSNSCGKISPDPEVMSEVDICWCE